LKSMFVGLAKPGRVEHRGTSLDHERHELTVIQIFGCSNRSHQHHHTEQHCRIWEQYKASSYDEKIVFFDGIIPFKSTIPHHFSHNAHTTLSFPIQAPIVDII